LKGTRRQGFFALVYHGRCFSFAAAVSNQSPVVCDFGRGRILLKRV
jgi:hypothetical protein